MTIPTPDLDDRTWAQMVDDARAYLQSRVEGWTDFSPGDPGMVLIELFAHVTEHLLFQLNQVPDKLYVEFLKLMGLELRPPAAASVTLQFATRAPATAPIAIPRGTRAGLQRSSGSGEPPVFTTAADVSIAPGEQSVEVLAHHAELVEAELIGTGTGLPGQSARLRRPPVVSPTGDDLDLLVGVEVDPSELSERTTSRIHDEKTFRIWEEVDSFVDRGPQDAVYVADRRSGTIAFAPALRATAPDGRHDGAYDGMAAAPPQGREIRAWYRRGGGPDGNVAAGSITVLKDSIAGVSTVINPAAATGGRREEELADALLRGPQQLHTVERAMTARDYEAIALHASGAVARARAYARRDVWAHAEPGTVEVLIVPHVDPGEVTGAQLTAAVLHDHETETARLAIASAVDAGRPLATQSAVTWASYKSVAVRARVVVGREETPDAVRGRVLARLNRTINPLPSPGYSGWRFGQPLRASDVFDIVLREPGVRHVEGDVAMEVALAPDGAVRAVATDAHQPSTWYAGAGDRVFRSVNDARSWEAVAYFEGERVDRIRSHPERPGMVAALTKADDGSRLHLSLDAGESWDTIADVPELQGRTDDIAWSMNGPAPSLMLAAERGLYQLTLASTPIVEQVIVVPDQTQGFYAVAVNADTQGFRTVAVAATGGKGVFVSSRGGASGTFRDTGMQAQDVRVLAIQVVGPRAYLWAGAVADGDADGDGASRRELRGDDDEHERWIAFAAGWKAGSCWGLAFAGDLVVAASHHGGVLRLDPNAAEPAWRGAGTQPNGVDAGLKLRDPKGFLFAEIRAVAARRTDAGAVMLAGTQEEGVRGSTDEGVTWSSRSDRVARDTVWLPPTWLMVSADHDITVVQEGTT